MRSMLLMANKKAQRFDVEGMIKAGVLLIIVGAIFGGTLLSDKITEAFSGLGLFLVIIAAIIGFISLFFPHIRSRR